MEDAEVAAAADFIGLVFVPGRRRRLETEAAREIVDGLKGSLETAPKVVGLFADQPLDEVNRIINACNLDLAQLCGAESLAYCQQTAAQVIKVIHIPHGQPSAVSGQELEERVLLHREAGHLVTLDRLVEGLQGGTGESFDWTIAAELSQQGHKLPDGRWPVSGQRSGRGGNGASLGSGRLQRRGNRWRQRPPENPRFHPKRQVSESSDHMLTFAHNSRARNSRLLPVIPALSPSFPRTPRHSRLLPVIPRALPVIPAHSPSFPPSPRHSRGGGNPEIS